MCGARPRAALVPSSLRRASRVERRMSKLHLPDEVTWRQYTVAQSRKRTASRHKDTADVASASMPVGKFRSIRRMSRPIRSACLLKL